VSERYVDLSIRIVNYYILWASRLWCGVEGSYSICSAGEEILKFQLSAGFFTGLKCAEILHSAAGIVKRNQVMLYLGRSLSNKMSLSLYFQYIFWVSTSASYSLLTVYSVDFNNLLQSRWFDILLVGTQFNIQVPSVVTVFCHQDVFVRYHLCVQVQMISRCHLLDDVLRTLAEMSYFLYTTKCFPLYSQVPKSPTPLSSVRIHPMYFFITQSIKLMQISIISS
jgi:hypothetical protein